jgi:hypothetical protein
MEDDCIFYKVIEKNLWKKMIRIETWRPSSPLKLQMALAHSVKTHKPVCVNIQIFWLLKGGIDQWGVGHDYPFLGLELHRKQQILELHKIEKINLFMLGQ